MLAVEVFKLKDCDPLTELNNRHAFARHLHKSCFGNGWDDNSIYSSNFLCIDIDNFKKYNDENSLREGDVFLKKLAGKLRKDFPQKIIYRIGGDEFLIVMGTEDFIPQTIISNCSLKSSVLKVSITRIINNYFVEKAIFFHIEKSIAF